MPRESFPWLTSLNPPPLLVRTARRMTEQRKQSESPAALRARESSRTAPRNPEQVLFGNLRSDDMQAENQDNTPRTPIVARRVAEHQRLQTLPEHFGRRMMQVEALVYQYMRELSRTYRGGFWHFYDLSNGGFYMAPSDDAQVLIHVEGNDYEGSLSADAVGIVVSLFALCQLSAQYQSSTFVEHYHWLRDFALDHAECRAIFAAID
jgi:antirestriction protein